MARARDQFAQSERISPRDVVEWSAVFGSGELHHPQGLARRRVERAVGRAVRPQPDEAERRAQRRTARRRDGRAERRVARRRDGSAERSVQRRRRLVSRAWAVAVIAWAFVRTILVWAATRDYGLNPWAYLLVDVTCAAADAYTTPKAVLALIDARWDDAVLWASVSVAAFLLPDLYIFLVTDELPRSITAVILAVVVATVALTAVGIVRKVGAGRTSADAARVGAPVAVASTT